MESLSLRIERFGKKCINTVLKKKHCTVCSLMYGLDKERPYFVFENDYARNSTLELCANEIYDKNILGSVAELGVYRGDFAKNINKAFLDRELYLFDTFEGFDERDIETEQLKQYSVRGGGVRSRFFQHKHRFCFKQNETQGKLYR